MSLPPTDDPARALVAEGAREDESAIPALEPALRAAITERIVAHDLPGALEAARQASAPGRAEIVIALARLVAATERLGDEPPPPAKGAVGKGTVPLSGHGFVLFQLRMGNLAEAERALRCMVLEQASDHVARERLQDVIVLRGAISDQAAPAPAAPAGWLDKRKARPTGEGWGPAAKPRAAPQAANEWEQEIATNVLRPEQEAELLLRSGRPERALEVYRRILARDPARPGIAARVEEIEAMLDTGRAPIPGELTVQRDLRALSARPDARRAPEEVPASEPELPAIADDEPTIMGRRPKVLERAADPLAETMDPAAASPVLRANAPDGVVVHRIVRVG